MNDESIGGMIVCDSSEQARAIFEELKSYPYSAALILHDADDKETRKDNIDAFKKGTIDFLVVYNMLLTGFDAPRLKKLYLGRVIKDHNLLQALTRVNRPYKNYRYGYVVDFADIRAEFDKTNKAYFDELRAELGDEFKQYDNIFKSPETIEADLQDIKDVLFLYDTGNAEVFSQQISAIDDKQDLIQLRRALELYKELFNVAKLFGYDELADQFDLNNISALYSEVCNRIALINQKKLLEEAQDMSAILNLAMDEIEFHFRKVSEKELVIADKYQDTLNRTRKAVLHEQKSESRDELVRKTRRAMLELVRAMQDGVCDHPDAEQLMLELAAQLGAVKGKKSYGYLPKRLKQLVDEIVDEMERLPVVSKCYDQWLMLQGKVDSYYHDKTQARIPLSQQKEFRQIKNAVIQEAERLRLGEISFEEKNLGQYDEPEEFRNESYDYWVLRDVIRDESLTMEERSDAVSEMDKLAENGDMYAQYLMGKLWRDGPLLIPNSANARYWFEQAAEQEHIVAQYSLAKLYLSDDVEVRDIRLGMNWLYTAAVNGSHYAMYRLAKELLKGEHIKKNTASALEWFTRSAEGGNPYAQYMLGKLYLTGKEAPYDEERAVHWLTRSAEQNNQYAQYLLNHLEENRPPSAMLAVTRLLHHMSRIFRDNSVPKSRPDGIQIDRKRLKKLQEKRMALGHKLDDHEEQWPDLTM